MNLETQVLNLLSKNPEKEFTDIEVYEAIYKVKLSDALIDHHYKIAPTVGIALISLVKKGLIEIKLFGSPRYVIVYQIKK